MAASFHNPDPVILMQGINGQDVGGDMLGGIDN